MVNSMRNEIAEATLPIMSLQSASAEDVPIQNVFPVFWRHKLLILGVFVAVVVLAAVVIYRMPLYYNSTTVLLIDSQGIQPLAQLTTGETPQTDMVAIKTQVAIIRSPNLAERVVSQLDLTHAPEYQEVLDAPPSPLRQWLGTFQAWIAGDPPKDVPLTPEARARVVADMLLGKVSVTNDGKSYLIEISAQASDGLLSSKIANAFARTYLEFNRKLKIDSITEANTRFFDQLPPLAEKVRDADRAVQTFRVAHGLTPAATPGGAVEGRGATLADQQLAQVDAQLGEAVNDRIEKEARLQQITDALHGKGKLDSIPDIVGSALIQLLRQKQSEFASQQAGLETSSLQGNPHLVSVKAAAANVTATINAEIAKIAASITSSVEAARGREKAMRDRLNGLRELVASQSEAEIRLRDLQNQADAAREVYTSYLHRFQQTASLGLIQQPDAELIAMADVPLRPAGPRRAQTLALAGAVGAVLAGLFALLSDRTRRRGFVTPQDLEAAAGLSVIGFIPRLHRGLEARSSKETQFLFRQAVNHVRLTLEFGGSQHQARVVLVTSALPGEGKTYFATSLARSIATSGGRALLVECDMRRPSVARSFKRSDGRSPLAATNNSSEHHDGGISVPRTVLAGLDIATLQGTQSWPAAPRGGAASTRILSPSLKRARDEINNARSEYDLIVLDAPPVLACAEAELLCGVADGIIMVVRWAHTTKGSLLEALRALRVYPTRTIGAVLNNVNLKQLARSGSNQGELYRGYASYSG
jgi:succinoglycan biosynthesis transport protein ExoP